MTDFPAIQNIILNRRTIKPQFMNGNIIPDEQISELIELANWAPTHGLTEPWQFKIYAGNKVKEFCRDHAELYQQSTPADKFGQEKYDKLFHMGDLASHIIVAIMQRGSVPKITELEEIAAASCAIQNILLGAAALNIAAYWGSGGMAYKPEIKNYLGLREEDMVLGILYLGYSDKQFIGRRNTPGSAKTEWIK